MADSDLPVWTFPPNWKNGVVERLEWLTNVLGSRSKAEQRIGVRLTPRRIFEFTVNPVGRARSYLELWVHRLGATECLLPLWHDRGKLSSAVSIGDNRIPIDTTFREFEAGGLAVIWQDTFTWELLQIEAVDDTGLDLSAPVAYAWTTNTPVHPLRVMTMDEEVSSSALTGTVGEVQFTFTSNRANPLMTSAEPLDTYDGLPVVALPPNRMDALETQYARVMEELDQRIGRRYRYDENPTAFSKQFYNWRAVGREEHAALRETLYRLAGRQKAVWMPTFNDDIVIAHDVAALDNNIRIQKIGYKYIGGGQPIAGKKDLLLRDGANNAHFVRVTGTGTDPAPGQERLNLSANAGFTVTEGAPGSFMTTVRMDQDIVEITHHTDSDGVAECSAAFTAFSNTRSVTGPLVLPTEIREIAPDAMPCGTPGDFGACGPYIFDGIYARLFVEITDPSDTPISVYEPHPSTGLSFPSHRANPGGVDIGGCNNSYPHTQYETNTPDPGDSLEGQILWEAVQLSRTTFEMRCHYPIYDILPPGSGFYYRLVTGLSGTPRYNMTFTMFNGFSYSLEDPWHAERWWNI